MQRKIKITDADTDKYGLRVTHVDGVTGWIVGADGDYLLFDSETDAEKALRKMKRDENYSWNCTAVVDKFPNQNKRRA